MTVPLVSVIIPTHNRRALLLGAIQSVRDQTFTDWELIVVDDGSTDGTADAVRRLGESRLRLIPVAHGGTPARARNAGLVHATGTFVAFLDSDDIWTPRKLESQLASMQDGARWSYTGWSLVDESLHKIRICDPRFLRSGWIFRELLQGRAVPNASTVMAERELVAEAGCFDERFEGNEDRDLWLRLAQRAQVVGVPGESALIREHDERLTKTHHVSVSSAILLFRTWLRRVGSREDRAICRRHLSHLYCAESAAAARAGDWRDALSHLLRASALSPVGVAAHTLGSVRRRFGLETRR